MGSKVLKTGVGAVLCMIALVILSGVMKAERISGYQSGWHDGRQGASALYLNSGDLNPDATT